MYIYSRHFPRDLQLTLKQTIRTSETDVIKMCIQRPREILSSGHSHTNSLSSDSASSALMPSERGKRTTRDVGTSQSAAVNHSALPSTSRAQASHASATESTNINGLPVVRPKAQASHTDDVIKASTAGSVHVKSFQQGHRRTHSESSSVFFNRQKTVTSSMPNTVVNNAAVAAVVADTENSIYLSDPSHIAASLEKCLSSWSDSLFRKHVDHCPYVRLIQVNTGSQHNQAIHATITQQLNLKRGLVPSTRLRKRSATGIFAVGRSMIKPLDNLTKTHTVEDLVLAQNGASYLKEYPFVLNNLKLCSQELKTSSVRMQQVIGQHLQHPPNADDSFVQVETVNLNFEEMCRPEYGVLFSANSIYLIVVDAEKLVDANMWQEELGRIRVCLNNIRMLCKEVRVYFLLDKDDLSADNEMRIAEILSGMVARQKQMCACGHGLLNYQSNTVTDRYLFNVRVHAKVLQEQLLASVTRAVHPIGGGKRLPLLAIKLNQRMREEEGAFPIVTQTRLSQMLQQVS